MTVAGDSFPAAVLTDMDGLLLDSERLARDAFVQACRDIGLPANLEVYHQCIGSTYAKTEEILSAHYGADFSYEVLDTRWSHLYHARLAESPVPVKDGARELLEFLTAREIPIALVTSTRRGTAVEKLEKTGLHAYFAHLICGGETELGKPSPDPYLAAARGLDMDPRRCWALEDSVNGVRAALSAGCVVYQVPDLVAPTEELRRLGHRIVMSLHDVLALLEALDRSEM